MKKLIGILTNAFLIGAICFLLVSLQALFVEWKTGELQFIFGYKPMVVTSGSMEPVIETGDVVLIREAVFSEALYGEIILFQTGDQYVIHRLLGKDEAAYKKDEPYLITKGDNNNTEDMERIYPENILGTIEHIF